MARSLWKTMAVAVTPFFCSPSCMPPQAIQMVTATLDGVSLPPSTGQVTDFANCRRIVANNLASAPALGYVVQSGNFTDPATHITITQDCLSASNLYDPAPIHPFDSSAPDLVSVPCPAVGPGTDVWFIFGQSNAGNFGDGRHKANKHGYAYAGNGICFQLNDPIAGGQGTDAGPWARLADKTMGGTGLDRMPIANIIVIERAIGGSSVKAWMPGGSQNPYLIAQLQDAIVHGLTPTRLFWIQGEADVGFLDGSTWAADFNAMLSSVRLLGAAAPIYVATATICNERGSENYPATEVLNRPADWYIWSEAGRIQIRKAQAAVVNGADVRRGPNLDLIDISRRRDGCHFGPRGLDDHAEAWFQILTRSD
jgi:hypothetical protein